MATISFLQVTGFPSFKIILGNFRSAKASFSLCRGVEGGLLIADDASGGATCLGEPASAFDGFEFGTDAESGLTRFDGVCVGLSLAVDLLRKLLELTETGTVVRGAEAIAWAAAPSKDANILRVRSSQPSTEPCDGSEIRPPRRFFVADSSYKFRTRSSLLGQIEGR